MRGNPSPDDAQSMVDRRALGFDRLSAFFNYMFAFREPDSEVSPVYHLHMSTYWHI